MTRTERIEAWAKDLTAEQMRRVLVELVDFAVDAEMVSFWDSALVPYWSNTGDPLVDGQQTYEED